MNKPIFKKSNFGIYTKLLLTLLITVIVVTIIVSLVLYIDFESKIDEQIFGLATNTLYQLSQNANFMASTAKTLSIQLYFDNNISNILLYEDPSDLDTIKAMSQLDLYRLVTPYVESIYIYNGANGNFYISDDSAANTIQNRNEFFDREIINLIDDYDEKNQFKPIPRVVPPDSKDIQKPASSYVYTFMFTSSYIQKGNSNNFVIVNISQDVMYSLSEGQASEQESTTIILDTNGNVAFDSKNGYSVSEFLDNDTKNEIMNLFDTSSHFVRDVSGIKSFIAFIPHDSLGWKYVAVLPYESIYSKINSLKVNTILLISALLVLSFIFAPIVAKRLYKPIEKMISNLKKLETEKRNNYISSKQAFLRNLVLESEMRNPDELASKIENYGIELNPEGYFIAVLFKIDNFFEFYEKYNLPERNGLRKKLMQLMEEEIPGEFNPAAVDMKEDRIIMLINIKQDYSVYGFEALTKQIQESAVVAFGISLTAVISTIGETVNQVTYLYNQVIEASFHRLFFGRGCVIFAEDMLELNQQKYDFPYEKEKLLIDSLLSGNKEGVETNYLEIIDMISGCSHSFANMAFSNLIFNINKAIDIVEKNTFPGGASVLNRLIVTLNDHEVIEDINKKVIDSLKGVIDKVEEKRLTRHDDIVDKINDIIERMYMNQNLSIDLISQELGISTSYLCRLYKRYSSITILDHITGVRMRKAKEMLKETNLPVSQIAENVGFNNSTYFYRCFKKENGITPNEYRQNLKHPL